MQEAARLDPPRPQTRTVPSTDRLPRRAALAAAGIVLVPIVVAAVRALVDGWFPVGDNALFVIRARDVLGGDLPLLGTWSSASRSMGVDVNHPGPLLFDLLALPVRLLPDGTGVALGIAVLDVVVVGGAIAGAWRRGGPVLAAVAAAVAAALCWSMGSEVLIEPWNPHSMVLPFLCFLVLAWCLVDGDVVVLPVAAAVASLLVQTHLSYGLLVPGLTVVAVGGLVLALRRRRAADPSAWPRLRARAARSALVAVVVLVACWAQPVTEQLFGEGSGNLTRLAEGTTAGSEVVGWDRAARMVGDVTGIPPWWLRPSFAEAWRDEVARGGLAPAGVELRSLSTALAGLAVVAVALLGCALVARRRRDGTAAAGLTVAAAALALALFSAARAPVSDLGLDYTLAPHQYRWLWAIGAFLTLATVGTLVRALTSGPGRSGRARVVVTTLAVVTAVVAGLNLPASDQGTSALPAAIPVMRELDDQLGPLADDGPYLIDDLFRRFADPYGASILAGLQDRGIDFVAEEEGLVRQLGEDRRFDGSNARSRLLMVVGETADQPFAGEPDARRLVLHESLEPGQERELERLRGELEAELAERGSLPLNERGRRALAGGAYAAVEVRPFDAAAAVESRALMIAALRGHLEGDDAFLGRSERYAELQLRLDEGTVSLFTAPLR